MNLTSQAFKRTRRILLGSVGLTAIAIVAGVVYQAVMEARDDRRYPPPGRLIDVDGHQMHSRTRASPMTSCFSAGPWAACTCASTTGSFPRA
jgi:hypothetical protein